MTAILLAAGLLVACSPVPAASWQPPPIPMKECLVIPSVGRYGRAPIHTDAIEAQIVSGEWKPPREGDSVQNPEGAARSWQRASAGADGWLAGPALNGGYVYWPVESTTDRIALLEASGHNLVNVNGEPRAGDPYQYGYVRLPVHLRAGRNDLLFQCGRGRLRAQVTPAVKAVALDARDSTLPDIVIGASGELLGALVIINASDRPANSLRLSTGGKGIRGLETAAPAIPPCTTRKVIFRIRPDKQAVEGKLSIRVRLLRNGAQLDEAPVEIRIRRPDSVHKRTFISKIDGSLQYYAVNPARNPSGDGAGKALFLTLHGASVEALGQAEAYSGKSWGTLVAPTNRRPYGFDWEDWGRLDALEALDLAAERFKPDPRRIYLTGHSMGGHGTWHIGSTFPDRFAAIGPSAGWISFWSYAGGFRYPNPNPMQEMLMRAASPSDTIARLRNFGQLGVYILHGDADDNVPVTEARTMKRELASWHEDLHYHEQPGAGHWWENSDEPGAECMDWPAMFDLFAHRAIPPETGERQLEFVTASPGISASSRWATIYTQIHPLKHSMLSLQCDPWSRRFTGKTENVARLALDRVAVMPGGPINIDLDGTKLSVKEETPADRIWLERTGESWSLAAPPTPAHKGPRRYGTFKDAFRNRMVFVYGTRGTAEETAWAYGKARFDAETFWYRGNGSVDVLPDSEFNPERERDRNVILYGNSETNGAWGKLLADSPVKVTRREIRIGSRAESGPDLACLFIRPRPGSDLASVGAVSGTGLVGMRLTDRVPYFLSGVAYPDCTVLDSSSLTKGSEGVRAAGFFGNDWRVDSGEWVWRDRARP